MTLLEFIDAHAVGMFWLTVIVLLIIGSTLTNIINRPARLERERARSNELGYERGLRDAGASEAEIDRRLGRDTG